ncbi:MAG: ATP-binding protein [bacterium]|nr:ATP-binding protein [bacterium]
MKFSLLPKKKTPSPQEIELAKTRNKISKTLGAGMVDVKDIIAPPALEVDFDNLKLGDLYFRTLFVSGYPRFVGANWLAPIINFDHTLDLCFYCYPVESKGILDDLRHKIAEMEATVQSDLEAGRVVDPAVRVALEDAQSLQEQLAAGIERFFQMSFYITIPAESLEELNSITKQVESTLGSLLVVTKHATLQQEDGFRATLPTFSDKLFVTRNMDTTSLATTFPFTSSELTANEGIMYGINEHNGSLIIFDRFTLENANSVVFAKSGAGKSYMVKLETLRSLMFGTEVIVIDPEEEYGELCKAIGGEYIKFATETEAKINPFDLSGVYEEGENELGLKILSLHSLFRVILGKLTSTEDAVLDRALILTYKQKGITPDPTTQTSESPVMEDLYSVLQNMAEPEAKSMAERLEKFIKGSLSGIFDQQSTVDIKNTFTVFSIRDLEDELRPIAMFIILDYIWTRIKKDRKRRILVVDEAWYLMKHPDSASFMYSIAKRARKYFLGLTTITQDVEDFLNTDYGKAIVTNSSIQILLKQSPASINEVSAVFYLSEGEKNLLLSADIGEGLFFAGANHVAIRVQAAEHEHVLITSNPKELEKLRRLGREDPALLEKLERGEIPPAPKLARETGPALPVKAEERQETPLAPKEVEAPPAREPKPEEAKPAPVELKSETTTQVSLNTKQKVPYHPLER